MRGNTCYCVRRGLCMVFQHEAGRVLALHRDGVSHVYWFRWFKEVWGIKILVSTHLEDPIHALGCQVFPAKGVVLVGCLTLVKCSATWTIKSWVWF